jgi:hypothetical protein
LRTLLKLLALVQEMLRRLWKWGWQALFKKSLLQRPSTRKG